MHYGHVLSGVDRAAEAGLMVAVDACKRQPVRTIGNPATLMGFDCDVAADAGGVA